MFGNEAERPAIWPVFKPDLLLFLFLPFDSVAGYIDCLFTVLGVWQLPICIHNIKNGKEPTRWR